MSGTNMIQLNALHDTMMIPLWQMNGRKCSIQSVPHQQEKLQTIVLKINEINTQIWLCISKSFNSYSNRYLLFMKHQGILWQEQQLEHYTSHVHWTWFWKKHSNGMNATTQNNVPKWVLIHCKYSTNGWMTMWYDPYKIHK